VFPNFRQRRLFGILVLGLSWWEIQLAISTGDYVYGPYFGQSCGRGPDSIIGYVNWFICHRLTHRERLCHKVTKWLLFAAPTGQAYGYDCHDVINGAGGCIALEYWYLEKSWDYSGLSNYCRLAFIRAFLIHWFQERAKLWQGNSNRKSSFICMILFFRSFKIHPTDINFYRIVNKTVKKTRILTHTHDGRVI